MEISKVGLFMAEGGRGSMKENNRLRRSALDKYFRKDSLVLFDPKYKRVMREPRPEHDARMKKAERSRQLRERYLVAIWLVIILGVATTLTILMGPM